MSSNVQALTAQQKIDAIRSTGAWIKPNEWALLVATARLQLSPTAQEVT